RLALELESCAHDHGLLAGEVEGFGGVGGELGGGEEEAFAPTAHAGGVARVEVDGGEEVGELVVVDAAFAVGFAYQGEQGGDVGFVHVGEAGGDVRDLVVSVAEVVDDDPLRGRHVRNRSRLEREDDDVLVKDPVVLDVGAHRERGGGLAAVEEDGGAGYALDRGPRGVELFDERA